MDTHLVHLGRMPYREAWDLQRATGSAVERGVLPDTILLVEHPPVYTVGRGARGSLQNLLWDEDKRQSEGIELHMVDRGGDITYHGPGQLVGYPILDLRRHGQDIHGYLRALEEAVMRTLARFGIDSERMAPHTGVFVGSDKIAAIGVKAANWVTQHGFALNVDPCLRHFTGIIPCGLGDKGVTSMARVLERPIALSEAMPVVEQELGAVFGFRYRPLDVDALRAAISGAESAPHKPFGGLRVPLPTGEARKESDPEQDIEATAAAATEAS